MPDADVFSDLAVHADKWFHYYITGIINIV